MKKVINKPVWRVDGLDLPINCVKDHPKLDDSGCYVEILEAIYSQLMAMLSYHNQILVVRADLHLTNNPDTNKTLSDILRKFKKVLRHRSPCL